MNLTALLMLLEYDAIAFVVGAKRNRTTVADAAKNNKKAVQIHGELAPPRMKVVSAYE